MIVLFWILFSLYAFFGIFIGQRSDKFAFVFPKQEKLFRCDLTKTRCCDKPLRFINRIPLISFFLRKGKCLYCHEKLPVSEVISSLIGAIVFAIVFLLNAEGALREDGIKICNLGAFPALYFLLFTISMIDVRNGIAYDCLSFCLMALNVIILGVKCVLAREAWFEVLWTSLLSVAISAVLFFGVKFIAETIAGTILFGDGDSILIVAVSILFPKFEYVYFMLAFALFALLTIIIYGIVPSLRTDQKNFNKDAPHSAVPCCPAIAGATILSFLLSETINTLITIL